MMDEIIDYQRLDDAVTKEEILDMNGKRKKFRTTKEWKLLSGRMDNHPGYH